MTYSYLNYPTVSQISPPKTNYLKIPADRVVTPYEQDILDFMENLFHGSIEGINQSILVKLQLSQDLFDFARVHADRLIELSNQWRATIKIETVKSDNFFLYYTSLRGKEEIILGKITFVVA